MSKSTLHVGKYTSPTVDGRNPAPVEVGSFSHYLQGFIHPRWLFGISEPSTVWILLWGTMRWETSTSPHLVVRLTGGKPCIAM